MSYRFPQQNMESLIGGVSSLDQMQLTIDSLDQSAAFIKAYGFDWENKEDQALLYDYYQQSLVFIKSYILNPEERVPEYFESVDLLSDLRQLLLNVSPRSKVTPDIRMWSCAFLKVIHLMVHFRHDMYSVFPDEIFQQIYTPFSEFVMGSPVSEEVELQNASECIRLKKFEIKPVKNINSGLLKLLSKRKVVALNIYDNIGFRFVTENVFDSFRVARFLLQNSVVSAQQSIPSQAANTLFPVNLFLEVMDRFRTQSGSKAAEKIEEILEKKLSENPERALYNVKENKFTGDGYRFIKFISRRLVRVRIDNQEQRFFYPFEVQIMTNEDYLKSVTGDLAHHKYKERQKVEARKRLFGKVKDKWSDL